MRTGHEMGLVQAIEILQQRRWAHELVETLPPMDLRTAVAVMTGLHDHPAPAEAQALPAWAPCPSCPGGILRLEADAGHYRCGTCDTVLPGRPDA